MSMVDENDDWYHSEEGILCYEAIERLRKLMPGHAMAFGPEGAIIDLHNGIVSHPIDWLTGRNPEKNVYDLLKRRAEWMSGVVRRI